MSFEKHSIVSAFVETYGSPYCLYDTEGKLYKAIAYALWEKLTRYEEQEALNNSKLLTATDVNQALARKLVAASDAGNIEQVNVYSQALQRIINL